VHRAKTVLEDISGEKVYGYRAPSYSITGKSLWALDILAEEGFSYDSSIFPIIHDIYGIPGGKRFIHDIVTQGGNIKEFPISTFPLKIGWWHYRMPIAGGGYLRLFPAPLIGRAINYINIRERQPTVVYFHPWEIDPDQPRIRARLKSRFRHYLNLDRMEAKIRFLLNNIKFSPMRDIWDQEVIEDTCMKILVTGNMGYVGSPVIRQLRRSYPDAKIIGMDIGYYSACSSPLDILPELRLYQ
jgi:polysaccharide deacetylase family protein (PEP-CTERM system associated)